MNRLCSLLSIAALTIGLVACGEQQKAPEAVKPSAQSAPAQAPAPAGPPAATSPAKSGKVIETMNASGYTYVHVDTGTEKVWAAAPETKVKVGDSVAIPEGMPMPNFQSKVLNRTFDVVYFVPALMVNGAPAGGAAMPPGHPPAAGMPPAGGKPAAPPTSAGAPKVTAPADISLKGIAKADQTVAEIYAKKAELAGKPVKVRGKVVKFSAGIMNKNWVHIQDGSGQAGSNDLTITTMASANPGDTVVASGKLTVNKDFGYGYKYDVIVEDGQIAKE